VFEHYGVEIEISRALGRKVWLKSGGYIIIDQTEALVAIDVNSGRYVGKKGAGASLEDTITKINCEAAKEIVYQLRLRNIGGIIICDFIDMEKAQNRDKVFKSLQEALGRDKAKTNVLRISELGLVEMTRKRVRESIGRMMHSDCIYCDGTGHLQSKQTIAYEILRQMRRVVFDTKDEARRPSGQPAQPKEVKPGHICYAAPMYRHAAIVKCADLHPAEIERVSRCPDDSGYSGSVEV